jgi:PAS domain S-box-containing protein
VACYGGGCRTEVRSLPGGMEVQRKAPEGGLATVTGTGVLDDTVMWAVLEAAPDGCVVCDADGRVVLVNGQAEALFGFDRKELVGEPVEVLVPVQHGGLHTAHRLRYRVDPKVRSMGEGRELWARRRDGTEFPVEVSLSPLDVASGRFTIANVRDVSARREAEAAERAVKHSLDVARDGILLLELGTARIFYANEGASGLTGMGVST